jgi:Mn2+/Fe2+ NRAMP family transporter
LFWVLFTGLIVLGALVGMVIPHGAVVQVLLVVQVVNGVLLPVLLIFIIRLVNKRAVMRRYTNGRVYNAVAWTTVAVAGLAVLMVLTTSPPAWAFTSWAWTCEGKCAIGCDRSCYNDGVPP